MANHKKKRAELNFSPVPLFPRLNEVVQLEGSGMYAIWKIDWERIKAALTRAEDIGPDFFCKSIYENKKEKITSYLYYLGNRDEDKVYLSYKVQENLGRVYEVGFILGLGEDELFAPIATLDEWIKYV